MTIASVTALVDAIRQARLLKPAQLDELTRRLQVRYSDPRALTLELMQRGWLTAQQVQQLLQPRPTQAVPVAIVVPPVPGAIKPPPASASALPQAIPVAAKVECRARLSGCQTSPTVIRQKKAKSRWRKWKRIGFLRSCYCLAADWPGCIYLQVRPPAADDVARRARDEREQRAEAEFQPIRRRFLDAGDKTEPVRKELLGFRLRFPGTSSALAAADLLAQFPSPLDKLSRAQVPPQEIYPNIPRDVVLVLGERAASPLGWRAPRGIQCRQQRICQLRRRRLCSPVGPAEGGGKGRPAFANRRCSSAGPPTATTWPPPRSTARSMSGILAAS